MTCAEAIIEDLNNVIKDFDVMIDCIENNRDEKAWDTWDIDNWTAMKDAVMNARWYIEELQS